MNKAALQKQLELKYNKDNLGTLLEPMKEGLLKEPLLFIENWLAQDFDFAERPDLIEVVYAVSKLDKENILWSIMTKVLLDESISIQGVMGMFFTTIGEYAPMPYRRGHVLNVFIEAVCSTHLITVQREGKYNFLKATISMGDRGQREYNYVLPSIVPPEVKTNKDVAYDHMHVITGGKLKQHDGEVCLDHVQRLSNIPYKVESRILNMVKPIFEEAPKYKEKKGRFETEEEVEERRKEFDRFNRELPNRIQIMKDNGNEFYYGTRYDVRLRSYVKAYHFDYIGNKYCRAFIQPTKGEIVNGAEEYI